MTKEIMWQGKTRGREGGRKGNLLRCVPKSTFPFCLNCLFWRPLFVFLLKLTHHFPPALPPALPPSLLPPGPDWIVEEMKKSGLRGFAGACIPLLC